MKTSSYRKQNIQRQIPKKLPSINNSEEWLIALTGTERASLFQMKLKNDLHYFYAVSHTVLICSSVQSIPSMKHVIQVSYFLKIKPYRHYNFVFFRGHNFYFYTRAMNENNLISWAYLQFIIKLQNSGKLHISSMIKVILDPEHVAIPSKIVPFVHINLISLVGHNLLKSNIRHLNILRHSPTPLARCTLATLSVNSSHKTLNGFHVMPHGLP